MKVQWRVKVTKDFGKVGKYSTLSPRQLKFVFSKPSVFDRLKFHDKVKLSLIEGKIFYRLQFPKVDEDPIPKGKKHVAEINVEEGVSSLKITIQDNK